MKDIHTPVRTLFYTTIKAQELDCYEAGAISDTAATPYVLIADISTNEDSNKTGLGNSVQILLDFVTSYPKNKVGGSKEVDTMASKVLAVINSKIRFEIFDGLQIVNTKVLQDLKQNTESKTHRIYRRLIRYQQLIMEV